MRKEISTKYYLDNSSRTYNFRILTISSIPTPAELTLSKVSSLNAN